jgi:hypothetical protein
MSSKQQEVEDFLLERVRDLVKFEVKLADKISFRILISSHSPETHRKGTALITQGAHEALATRGPRHCNDVLVVSPTPEQNARKPPMVHHVFTRLLCRF